MPLTPVVIYEVDLALLTTLESALGPPIDSYLSGWQVWIDPVTPAAGDAQKTGESAEAGDDDIELEYRLHPPAGFAQPEGISHHDLWDEVIVQAADGAEEFTLGSERRSLGSLWTLLEIYPAFGEDMTSEQVAGWAADRLGREASAHGAVDHDRIGGDWKRRGHDADLPGALRDALGAPSRP